MTRKLNRQLKNVFHPNIRTVFTLGRRYFGERNSSLFGWHQQYVIFPRETISIQFQSCELPRFQRRWHHVVLKRFISSLNHDKFSNRFW